MKLQNAMVLNKELEKWTRLPNQEKMEVKHLRDGHLTSTCKSYSTITATRDRVETEYMGRLCDVQKVILRRRIVLGLRQKRDR